MSGEDGERAIDLFSGDKTREFVWECDLAQREKFGGVLTRGVGPSVGAADGEDEVLGSAVACSAYEFGDAFGGALFAAAIEQDELRP